MVVGHQQIATAFDQPHHRIVDVQCNQTALERSETLAHARDPFREKGEGQRMRHRELDHVLAGSAVRAQHGAGAVQRLQHLERLLVQRAACGRQARRVRAAIDQIGPGPGLQSLDAARKRRLRHMAQLGRTAEAARLGQTYEIFKPLGFHRSIIRCARRAMRASRSAVAMPA